MPAPLRPLLAAVSSSIVHTPLPAAAPPDPGPRRLPFVTISRQAGAGGRMLMAALVDRLSDAEPGGAAWAGYDHELLEKVAERHGLDPGRLAALDPDEPHWLARLFEGLPQVPQGPTRPQVYRKVVNTLRQLARDGRCVIVGRGAALATADMPGGVHVRLVAPREDRVANLAQQRDMSHAHADAEVTRLDRGRDRFFKQYWGVDPLGPEHFHLTLNTARLAEPQLLDTIAALLPARRAAVSAEQRDRVATPA